ncbi:probable WRKY transcription factor 2 [Telopea speciosissima]|uniref:probable WRKY transcription factor 2 n=1 Tax=Telopea speciosissima TaxID=54955 RepID=UPI001CC4B9FF|nr:probable WRKY transcription factor 2 [Telopea speciosissima]
MAGIGDRVAVIGDWAPPDPSPRTFFSTALSAEDFGSKSFSELQGENGCGGLFGGTDRQKAVVNNERENDTTRCDLSCDFLPEQAQKSRSRGGLAERMATRAGFNAPKINTATIRSGNLSSSSDVRSPYLTIPPGLSPTTLLDSPVFLSNSLAQPSPTTGKLSFAQIINGRSSMLISESHERSNDIPFEELSILSAVFKPHMELNSLVLPAVAKKIMPETKPQQPVTDIEVSIQSENSLQFRSLEPAEVHPGTQNGLYRQSEFSISCSGKNSSRNHASSDPRTFDTSNGETQHSPPFDEQQDAKGDQGANGESSSMVIGGSISEDGYNWRKYGQKQVKGSEYPRSYYKCTHPNCQVKKKVERSHEGHITEIIYKGAHNHPKPPLNRRSAVGSSDPFNEVQLDTPEQVVPHAAATDGDPAWACMQRETVGGPDWRYDNLEVTSPVSASASASVGPELCDPSTSSQVQDGPHFDHGDALDVSSTLSNDDDEDDRGTHGSQSLDYDCEGDESESKRRKIDACTIEMSGTTRAIREPRVVVQTTSEVDILDDGYRWRKYGQKVVKGNPNPRSYYKCTSAGCTVRKHVERASHDLKSVITTYEGKHNHDVPTARNSSNVNPSSSSTVPAPAAQTHVQRPEPSQARDSMARFGRPASLGSFILPGRQQLGVAPDFSFELNHPSLVNLTVDGLGPRQGKLPVLPVYPYMGQQHQVNGFGTMMPKGEPKEEPLTDTGLNLSNRSVNHLIMNGHPLGPQL